MNSEAISGNVIFPTQASTKFAQTVSNPALNVRSASILIVHESENGRRTTTAALNGFDHQFFYANGSANVFAILKSRTVDLILIDLTSPERDALQLCRSLKENSATRFLPVYIIGNGADPDEEVRAFDAGADEFLHRPLRSRTLQARIQASMRHTAMVDSLDDSESVLFSLAQSVEERDPDLGQHCHRLALMGAAMGLTLGLPAEDITTLQRAGYLHDIGKVAIPDHVLFKPGPLTNEEWETMKSHTERGERICSGMKSLKSVLPIIRHHHERWDGSGYPDRLRQEQIPLLARILQLADIYDALTTARPYKVAATPEQALAILRTEVRKGWRDPKLVELFADLLPTFRTAPAATDHSHFSLHALANSVERFQPDSSRLERKGVGSELKLVSGF
jgi:putative two-component system response regulator